MSGIQTGDLILVGAVSFLHAGQLAMTSAKIGELRRKYKIQPPRTDGPDDFIRALRAQQNSLEFGVTFEVLLWLAGIFGHQIPAAVLGAVYVYSRGQYIHGYIEDAGKRVKPFWLGVRAIKGLAAVTVIGLVNTALNHYAGVNVPDILRQKFF